MLSKKRPFFFLKFRSIDQINSTVTPNWYWIYYAQYWKFKQQCVRGLQESKRHSLSVRHNILIAFFWTHHITFRIYIELEQICFMIYRNGRTDQKSEKGPRWTKKCYLDQSSSKKEPKHLTHLKYFWESELCASASDKHLILSQCSGHQHWGCPSHILVGRVASSLQVFFIKFTLLWLVPLSM